MPVTRLRCTGRRGARRPRGGRPLAAVALVVSTTFGLATTAAAVPTPPPATPVPERRAPAGQTDPVAGDAVDPTAPSTTTTEPLSDAPPSLTNIPTARYGPPRWLPLRHDLNGGDIEVGCTYDSHGSQFGYECSGHHDRWALDLIASRGTPVYAAGKGWATNLTGGRGGSGYGNVVSVDHRFGISTLYGHLSKILIKPGGQWVDQNTIIGLVGSTGTSSAPHLHFEERNALLKQAIDPGSLMACRAGFLVPYPQHAGEPTWKGLPWGKIHVGSDGTACGNPDGTPIRTPKVVAPAPDPTQSQAAVLRMLAALRSLFRSPA